MKANELMIGDWVMVNDIEHTHPLQVAEIFKYCGTYYAILYWDGMPDNVNPEKLTADVDKVLPIPLTPEILKKNGFGVQDQGGGRKDVWTGFGIDCEGDIEVEFQHNIPIYLKIDGGFKGEYYTSANIKYIHQLQHTLRLCGIDKAIKL